MDIEVVGSALNLSSGTLSFEILRLNVECCDIVLGDFCPLAIVARMEPSWFGSVWPPPRNRRHSSCAASSRAPRHPEVDAESL